MVRDQGVEDVSKTGERYFVLSCSIEIPVIDSLAIRRVSQRYIWRRRGQWGERRLGRLCDRSRCLLRSCHCCGGGWIDGWITRKDFEALLAE